MTSSIRQRVKERSITRLCHVTRSMALPFILEMDEILATGRLQANEQATFYPNDYERIDGHLSHVSCSIQYPNGWYMRSVRLRETLFDDWVVLLLDPDPLWWDDTLFCPVNAASERGWYIGQGVDAFDAMFDLSTPNGRVHRSMLHLNSCPTDNQAEVLVYNGIRLDFVRCLVVADPAQAARERLRMSQIGLNVYDLGLAVCPEFFDPPQLAGLISSGVEVNPTCRPWAT